MSWTTICKLSDILPFGGRCALIDGQQVAIFRIQEGNQERLYALSNYDPFSKANALSRGLIGCLNGTAVITSPIHKNNFSLTTGECLEDKTVSLETWDIQVIGDYVQVATKEAMAA